MSKITKAHKIRLNPTEEQAAYFWRAAGVARFAWNWGLAEYNRKLEAKEPVSGRALKKIFVATVKPENPWLSEVSSYAYQGAFDDLQKAVRRYFDFKKQGQLKPPIGWKKRKDGKPYGWPRFKSRDKVTPAFYQANICIKFDGNLVQIQKCPGPVNMAEPLRFEGKIMGARISYSANHWWLSVQVETEHESTPGKGAVGVDLGIKYLAVTSDGEIFDNPKPLQAAQRKLRRLQRKLDRQRRANNPDNYNENGTVKTGSKTWIYSAGMKETEAKIAKLNYRIACIRNEASHQLTTGLARNYAVIGIEDLNIKGMMQNRRLSKAVADAALYEKRRQLEYKAGWNDGLVVPVSQWFPSSKKCNNCGTLKADLKLSDRQWTCENCGSVNHRDGNAALNIRDEALRILQE